MTRALPDGIFQMQSPELIHQYLECLHEAFKHLRTLSSQSIEKLSDADQLSEVVINQEIQAVENLIAAYKEKFRFNHQLPEIHQAPLYICRKGSGLPAMSELLATRNAQQEAEGVLEKLSNVEQAKQEIIRSILKNKTLPVENLHELSMRRYYQQLTENTIFTLSRTAKLEHNGDQADDTKLLHWSTFDAELSLPVLYLVEFRYSGKSALTPESELLDWINTFVQGKAFATLKLLYFAKEFDQRFEDVHPISIRRIILGPFYMKGVTDHNEQIARILDQVSNPKDQWLLVCSTETLLSKGERTVKKGFFSSQIEQIYDVDHQDFNQFNAGATRTQQDVFLPYEAYQVLQEQTDNPIYQYNKYLTFDH